MVVLDPEVLDDDIILFKHESVFLNDIGLFKRAINKMISGYDAIFREVIGVTGSDIFIVKVGALKNWVLDFPIGMTMPFAERLCEGFVKNYIEKNIKNPFVIQVSKSLHSNFLEDYSHWKDTAYGFYHRCPRYLRPLTKEDCHKKKWWDKKNYSFLFE
jgi:hypothetical protein